ncbi:MAG: FAD-binding oxidoreductase [Calditrichaeota bacterium]|nr:FAD-binding oxidoreductase [Calditrichota bacterium]
MTAQVENDLKFLLQHFEKDQIQWDEKTIANFSIENKFPQLVIFPKSYEQIQTAIKLARKLKKSVFAGGNNRCRDLTAKPNDFDWAISTSQLNQIVRHDAADFTITVQAGVLLSDIQKQIKKKNQFLPLDPFDAGQQTISGIVAINSAGSYRFHFGTCQDFVLGMKVILPDGRLIKTGGKTVKNVAGYNLSRLFTGSWGTLGVIAEITLKLSPIAPLQRTVLIGFEKNEHTAQASQFIRSSNMVFDRLNFLNEKFLKILPIKNSAINPQSKYFLLLSASGNEKAIVHSIQRLEKEISSWNTFLTLPTGKQGDDIWQKLSDTGFQQVTKETDFWLQVTAPKAKIWHLMNEIETTFPDSFLHGLAGNGVMNIFFKPKNEISIEMKNTIGNFRQSCAAASGFVVGKKVPAEYRDAATVWGDSNGLLPLMKSVKRKLDPDGIMVSGRYFGGI